MSSERGFSQLISHSNIMKSYSELNITDDYDVKYCILKRHYVLVKDISY